ncbi:hypothetical protein AB0M39_24440 [Streptomyces sp. NPDC051907]|uniref:hypothetical protein n=1 Tax=Streptomyces sp. NPDC051907 TaxID=3155284 RepID=UPI003415513F
MTTDSDHLVVVEEFAELRRSLDVGLARIDGQLALLAHRNDQVDRDLNDLAARVGAMEQTRWPLPAMAALTALGALAVTVWQALGH